MPKRSRQDSPYPPPSPSSDSGQSTRTSTDVHTQSSRASTEPPTHSNKYIQTSHETPRARTAMKCSLPPHHETLAFPTFEDFEIHYNKVHANRCTECRRNFPTEHFLGLHISENHDPLEEARRAKGEKTYRCFVQDCDKLCSTPHKRRMHLTSDKHLFPKNYDFLIVNMGIDKRSSMLRTGRHRRGSSAASRALYREQQQGKKVTSNNSNIGMDLTSSPEEVVGSPSTSSPGREKVTESPPSKSQQKTSKPDIEELTSTMSALNFVPPSVRFGRGGRRGGLARS